MKFNIVIALAMQVIVTADANGQCPTADRYCLGCSGLTCVECAYSYADTNGICQPPTTYVDNCVAYANATVCASCDEGYYLSGNTCVEITITDCVALDSTAPTKCVVCDNAYKADPAAGTCTDTVCGITNCAKCSVTAVGTSNVAVCVECNSGYALNSSFACVAELTGNCLIQDSSACSLCE